MEKIYVVRHNYDVDGGFGDAVFCMHDIACFENLSDAEAFVKKFSYEHVYDKPYAALRCGKLTIDTVDIIKHDEFDLDEVDISKMWWLRKGGYP